MIYISRYERISDCIYKAQGFEPAANMMTRRPVGILLMGIRCGTPNQKM